MIRIIKMKGKYKRVQYWCYSCDGEIVQAGMKCPNCGVRDNHSTKIKSPSKAELLKEYYNG